MNEQEKNQVPDTENTKKKWFGRGIYGSKDVPIRVLDTAIGVLIAVILIMILYFAVNGGYTVSFDSAGGTEVTAQKLKHGAHIKEPESPLKPGYTLEGWYTGVDLEKKWDFDVDTVEEKTTLTAKWVPANILVRFDTGGGEEIDPITVTYGEPYGSLPEPKRTGKTFDGWTFSGKDITESTTVFATDEHVLYAKWK